MDIHRRMRLKPRVQRQRLHMRNDVPPFAAGRKCKITIHWRTIRADFVEERRPATGRAWMRFFTKHLRQIRSDRLLSLRSRCNFARYGLTM
jgi:hypothetical protein